MSYENKQYTNPGWNNSVPPPLNSSNLNDISNAIQALNISSENRSTLGMSGTQDMQDGLVLLKNAITTMQSDLQEVQTNMAIIASGSYVGNNQTSITITFDQLSKQPKIIFINSYTTSGSYRKICCVGIGINGYVAGIEVYIDSDDLGRNGCTYAGIYTVAFTTSSVTMSRLLSGDSNAELNTVNTTYNYILLG